MKRRRRLPLPAAMLPSLAFAYLALLGARAHSEAAGVTQGTSAWLLELLQAAAVVILALILAVVRRRQRPEPAAAWLGLAGSLLLYASPWFQLLKHGEPPVPGYWLGQYLFLMAGPFALACWLGANLWRLGTWRGFWQGAGGAIVRGGIAAWLVALPIALALRAFSQQGAAGHPEPVLGTIGDTLHHLPLAAIVTAILVSRRPSPGRAALAGAVLAVALVTMSLVVLFTVVMLGGEATRLEPASMALNLAAAGLLGAVAGLSASYWKGAAREM